MDDEGELDLTSEPELLRSAAEHAPAGEGGCGSDPVRVPLDGAQEGPTGGRRIRVLFRCCRVDAYLVVPPAVLAGQTSVWRVHCVRCGRLVEIPV
ncbi:MAG: hypothetical protein D6753_06080 [Planctomycetota bacterium]|nr:MAG: hypothetical protein D6753_06080 [Planctomycetota bacterium]